MSARLLDNGQRPVLDLHGCTVDRALALTRALIVESVKRGRDSVELIHGASTSDPDGHRRTIKLALRNLIDSGAMTMHVSGSLKRTTTMILALRRHAGRTDTRRITLRDISRR